MEILFQGNELQKLFWTYHRQPQNYQKIKEIMLDGEGTAKWKRDSRGRWLFLAAVTFVALVSSVFAGFASEWTALGALWMIWGAIVGIFAVVQTVLYQRSYKRLDHLESLIERFEFLAAKHPSWAGFERDWSNTPDKAIAH